MKAIALSASVTDTLTHGTRLDGALTLICASLIMNVYESFLSVYRGTTQSIIVAQHDFALAERMPSNEWLSWKHFWSAN